MVWRMDRTSTPPTPDSSVCTLSAHLPDSDTARRGPRAAAPPRCAPHGPYHLRTPALYICRVQLKFRIRFLVVSTEYGRLNCPLHESTSSTRLSTTCRLMFRSACNCSLHHVPRSCFFGSSSEACCEGQRLTGSSPRTEPRRRRGRLGGNSTELASVCLPQQTALILHA